MNILIASGSFKDVFSPLESCTVIGDIIKSIDINKKISVKLSPIVDGGEYSNDVLINSLQCKKIIVDDIINPYGKKTKSFYLELNSQVAFISSSEILRLSPSEDVFKNPLKLTSYGLGQLIVRALKKGYKQVFIGLGGTNTIDCGIGLAQAFGINFRNDRDENILTKNGTYLTGADLNNINSFSNDWRSKVDTKSSIITLCDGTATLNQMYTPNMQKIGTYHSNENVIELYRLIESGIKRFKSIVEDHFKKNNENKYIPIDSVKYFGIAGGINLSLSLLFNLKMKLGIEHFIKILNIEDKIKWADLVITGEGKLDNSLGGKTPIGICKLAKKYNKSTLLIAGDVSNDIKEFFPNLISKNLPEIFANAGVDNIISCHKYYEKIKLPKNPHDRSKIFKKLTPEILAEGIASFLKKV